MTEGEPIVVGLLLVGLVLLAWRGTRGRKDGAGPTAPPRGPMRASPAVVRPGPGRARIERAVRRTEGDAEDRNRAAPHGRKGWATAPPPLPPGCRHALVGRAWVIDGDTIVIRHIKVRLWGIDAPELDEPWGRKAKGAMIDICRGSVVTATLTGETTHDRYVARCTLADGTDICAELIRRGLALDWPLFSGGHYRDLEQPDFRRRLAGMRRRRQADRAA